MLFIICVLTSLCILLVTFSAPLPEQKIPPDEMVKFMKQYGYIEAGPNTEFLYTEEGFTAAIRQMQKFGGLPETGLMDNATLALMKSPRCGVPDVVRKPNERNRTKRYVIGAPAWRKKKLTYFLANWPPELNSVTTTKKLEEAFKVWSAYTPLKFISRSSMDSDLIIAFGRGPHGDGYPFDGRGNILAHAFFPYEHGSYGGDIHFDDDENWIDGSVMDPREVSDQESVDFFTVAAHEIGHSLGLAHSTVTGSIMFPYYKGYNSNMRLDYDDIYAMYNMYVVNNNFEDDTQEASFPEEPFEDDDGSYHPDERDSSDKDVPFDGNEGEHLPDKSGGENDYSPDYEAPDSSSDEDEVRDSSSNDDQGDADENKEADDYPYTNDDEGNRPEIDVEDAIGVEESDENILDVEGKRTEDEVTTQEKESDGYFPDIDQSKDTADSGNTSSSRPDSEEEAKTKPKHPSDVCDGSIDAASLIRGELFVFRGLFMWRMKDRGIVMSGYPVPFHVFFSGFPRAIDKIDAVYQRPQDYHIVFFTGSVYWVFDGNSFIKNSPRSLSNLGLPNDLDHLDAAIVWDKNRKTYFFSGNFYWRFDETKGKVERGYPQRIERWKGIPSHLDTAFTWKDGKTYFFRGNNYWNFNNKNISVEFGYPQPASPYWFNCPL